MVVNNEKPVIYCHPPPLPPPPPPTPLLSPPNFVSFTLTFTTLWANSASSKLIFFYFSQKTEFDICMPIVTIRDEETFCMKCQILFPGINKKNISMSFAKKLPRVLSIKASYMKCKLYFQGRKVEKYYQFVFFLRR